MALLAQNVTCNTTATNHSCESPLRHARGNSRNFTPISRESTKRANALVLATARSSRVATQTLCLPAWRLSRPRTKRRIHRRRKNTAAATVSATTQFQTGIDSIVVSIHQPCIVVLLIVIDRWVEEGVRPHAGSDPQVEEKGRGQTRMGSDPP